MKNNNYETIRHEISTALKYRCVDVDNERIDELSDIVSCIYKIMKNHQVTYKEAESILITAGGMLDKVPIGRMIC